MLIEEEAKILLYIDKQIYMLRHINIAFIKRNQLVFWDAKLY